MTTIATEKSPALNRLEGFALVCLFQGFPTFAATVLMLRLVGDHQLVGHPGHATTFVLLATPIYALLGPWLGRRFPKTFKNGYEPLFFDAGLSFSEKIARWRIQPMSSLQLLSSMMLLSVLAVGVASLG